MSKETFLVKYAPHIVIVLFCFILYGNTITLDYALDDTIVITGNSFTAKGFGGIKDIFAYDSFRGYFGKEKKLVSGGRYRPFSIATFAIEYSLFGGFKPGFSHFINIVLYAFTGILIFLIFTKLIKNRNKAWYLGIPFLTALLFMAHPVHTEAVANIKGRDELFALLFSLLTLYQVIRFLETRKIVHLITGVASFFLGLLSKENAIMFVIIIPLTLYFFTSYPVKKIINNSLLLVATAGLFVFIRFLVLGYINSSELPPELLNNPFLNATESQHYGTILYTLGLYIKLLFFPHPLTHDYYPYHIPLVSFTDPRSLIPLLIYAALIIYSLMNLKKKGLVAYGILFYLITLFIVSNLMFPVGTFMNERFIYMPSLGYVLIVGWFFSDKLHSWIKNESSFRRISIGILAMVLFLFTVKTIARNKVWKDDFTLFSTDVLVSDRSAKCLTSAGGKYLEKAKEQTDTVLRDKYYQMSIGYLNKSISIYPTSSNSLVLLGNAIANSSRDYKKAISEYLLVLQNDPNDRFAFINTVKVLEVIDSSKDPDYKLGIYKYLSTLHSDNADILYQIGKLYGQFKGQLDTAELYFRKSISIDPNNPAPYKDLGVIYGIRRNYTMALDVLNKAASLDPNDKQVQQNLAITHRMIETSSKK
jgi:protein O-mannosyl-transferase